MQSNQSPKYLVLVFGPPASGKSTLAKSIRQSYYKQRPLQRQGRTAIVLSPDCLEEFLSTHTVEELKEIAHNKDQMEKVMSLKLKRSQFKEQNWKASRAFVKETLALWFTVYNLIILQDDMLLKSQRKHFRHFAQQNTSIFYLEICISPTLEECLSNLQARSLSEQKQYSLSPQTCREAYSKFQIEPNAYVIFDKGKQAQWNQISQCAKVVLIQHNQLRQKTVSLGQNALKDQAQIKIRKFISEIMSNKQLQKKYFQNLAIKDISSFLTLLKKKYCPKNKTFEGFLSLFKSETERFL